MPLIAGLVFSLALAQATPAGAQQTAAQVPVSPPVEPQDLSDLFRRIFKKPPPPPDAEAHKTQRTIFPTIGATPAGGVAFGVLVGLAGGDVSDPSTLWNYTISANYSTKKRTQIVARGDQRFDRGAWRLMTDVRFYDFTERTYGLGSDRPQEPFVDIKSQWGRAHARAYRRVLPNLAVGAGYLFDIRQYDPPDDPPQIPVPIDEDRKTISSGVSLESLFDSRDNPLNASRGWMGRVSWAWYPEALGSEREWDALQAEARTFLRLPGDRRQILAVWTFGTWTTGGVPPYFDLPSMGWDYYGRTARGYPAGRFRGQDWLYGEVEYRVDLLRSGLAGAVAFLNTSSFSDLEAFGPWVAGGGFGFRLKLDKKHGSNLCLDFGWGKAGNRGVFLSLNEAF